MGKLRFVQTETVRLPLSDGDWVDIKRELSVGESRDLSLGHVRGVRADGSYDVDGPALGFAKVVAYVLDWSFVDAKDKRVPVSKEAIKALSQEAFDEVDAAIDAHVNAWEEAKKKMSTAVSAPAVT